MAKQRPAMLGLERHQADRKGRLELKRCELLVSALTQCSSPFEKGGRGGQAAKGLSFFSGGCRQSFSSGESSGSKEIESPSDGPRRGKAPVPSTFTRQSCCGGLGAWPGGSGRRASDKHAPLIRLANPALFLNAFPPSPVSLLANGWPLADWSRSEVNDSHVASRLFAATAHKFLPTDRECPKAVQAP